MVVDVARSSDVPKFEGVFVGSGHQPIQHPHRKGLLRLAMFPKKAFVSPIASGDFGVLRGAFCECWIPQPLFETDLQGLDSLTFVMSTDTCSERCRL